MNKDEEDQIESIFCTYLYMLVPVVALPRNYRSTTRHLEDLSMIKSLEKKLADCTNSNDSNNSSSRSNSSTSVRYNIDSGSSRVLVAK